MGTVVRPSLLETDLEHAFFVAAIHALHMLERNVFAIMIGGSFDEALSQCTEFPFRLVAHEQGVGGGCVEVEDRHVRSGIEFPDFRMNDVIHGQQKPPCIGLSGEEIRVLLRKQGHGLSAKPAQNGGPRMA